MNGTIAAGVTKAVAHGAKAFVWKTQSKIVALPKTASQSSGESQAPLLGMTSVPTPTPPQTTHQTQGMQDEPLSDPRAALQIPDAEALKAASSFAQPTCSSTYAQMASTGLATSSKIPVEYLLPQSLRDCTQELFEEEDVRLVKDNHSLDELVGYYVELKQHDVVRNLLVLTSGSHAIRSYRSIAARSFGLHSVAGAYVSVKLVACTRARMVIAHGAVCICSAQVNSTIGHCACNWTCKLKQRYMRTLDCANMFCPQCLVVLLTYSRTRPGDGSCSHCAFFGHHHIVAAVSWSGSS